MPDPAQIKQAEEIARRKQLTAEHAKEIVREELEKLKQEQKRPDYKSPPIRKRGTS